MNLEKSTSNCLQLVEYVHLPVICYDKQDKLLRMSMLSNFKFFKNKIITLQSETLVGYNSVSIANY